MQKRNVSLLKFQERLIKAAMQSPRREAMNLMGIIYSNLEEFIRVRIPMDGDINGCADCLLDTLDLFDYAIRMKFSNLYMSQLMPLIPKLKSFDEIETLYTSMRNGEIGCFIRGVFYHSNFIFSELAFNLIEDNLKFALTEDEKKRMEEIVEDTLSYVRMTPLIISGSRLRVSVPPYLVRSDDLAVDVVKNWVNDEAETYDTRVIFTQHFSSSSRGQYNNFALEKIYDNDITISFINPIFIHFDKVAKAILKKSTSDTSLVYKDEIPKFYQYYRGSDFVRVDQTGSAIIRNPFDPAKNKNHNMVIDAILRSLCINRLLLKISRAYLNETDPKEHESLARYLRGFCQTNFSVKVAYMSIYRTDHDYTKDNIAFIVAMAIVLKENCHVFIEARARDDEKNNVNLAKMLKDIGATVHVQSHGFQYKVHSKIWHFRVEGNFAISVFSTGNFVTSAQNGFADTVVIEKRSISKYVKRHHEDPELSSIDEYLKYVYYPKSFDDKKHVPISDEKFIWYPGDIRSRLIDLIHHSTKGQFIWIKCNHLTDSQIIKELKAAAARGVAVRLIIRTTCCISHSDFVDTRYNMEGRSIVGRYLEHDRWYIFGDIEYNGTTPHHYAKHAYISSADLMPRNLNNRVEFMFENDDTVDTIPGLFLQMYEKKTSADEGYFNIPL